MSSLRKRDAIMKAVGIKMLEEGRVLDKRQYDSCKNVPVRSALILNHFGSWSRLLGLIKNNLPEIWEEIEAISKPTVLKGKPEFDPLEALAAKKYSSKPA